MAKKLGVLSENTLKSLYFMMFSGGNGRSRIPGAIARTTLFKSAPFDQSSALPMGCAFYAFLQFVQANW